MASRVNTRFVVLLIVGVIALLGMVVLAWSVVMKSAGDLAAKGDEFMQQGDYKQAEFVYSKAVNKDTTNVEYINKWIDSLEKLVPETETEYRDRFFGDYTGAIRQAATVLRNDIGAHERSLQITYKLMINEYSRGSADRLIEDSTNVLAYFDNGLGQLEEAQEWERLRRYRGIAITEIARRDGVMADGQMELGIEDLERAVAANPDDTESRIKLLNLRTLKVERDTPESQIQPRIDVLRESLNSIDGYLTTHPDDIMLQIQRVLLQVDIERRQIDQRLSQTEKSVRMNEIFEKYRDDLSQIASEMTDADFDLKAAELFGVMEQILDPESNYSRTRRMLDLMIEDDRENAELLYYAGKLAQEAADYEEGIGWYKRIGELSKKPLSYEGLRQFSIQRRSLLSQSEIRVDQAFRAADAGETALRDSLIDQALTLRNEFASEVQEDNLALMLLDGKIASVQERYDEALRLFKRFNEQTQRVNPEGLWYEGLIASQLGQYGVARDALELLIPIDNSSRRLMAMLTLAQIHERLQNYETAAGYYRDILAISPSLQPAKDGLENVNKLINPELNDDPVIAAVLTARRMRTGNENQPGDYAGAVQLLRESVEEFDYDPRVARELAGLLLDSGDVEGAKTLIDQSAERHPDDESMQRMQSAMTSGDIDQILVQMIRDSERSEIEKLLAVASVASSRDMTELLTETVSQLNAIAPDDKRVIELTFVDAMRRGDTQLAQSISQRAGLTSVESLSFRARLAISQQKTEEAIEMLKQAAASGVADASIYQMLAILQRESGRVNDSLASFEQALSIRPDNLEVIREYLITLVRVQQYEQALSTARRLQRYGSSDSLFMNLWLNLESQFGGVQGRSFATRQRERLLELNPTDQDNAYQLARLYIQDRNWPAARILIDQLRSTSDRIEVVELDATWYAEQGTIDGRNGMIVANEIFASYIASLPAPVGPEPYIANSQFMLARGRPDLALVAANEAVKRQSTDTMIGSILLGDLQARVNNLSESVKAYRDVIEAGADDEDFTVRARLIESLVRLERFEEAQEVYNDFPAAKRQEMITMLQGADIANGLGETQRAKQILDNAVSQYPNESLVYIKRAEVMIGDETLLNDMLSDLGRAIDLDSDSWRAYRVRAAGYFAVDRRDDALEDLKSAIRLNPTLDRSIYAVLNEVLSRPNQAGEAAGFAREVISLRPDDANLMARIGGLFAARQHWDYASEFYGQAWNKRRGIGDGATYIDTLVRKRPPDAATANNVINALAAMVGDINTNSGLLAAQALVLQARGRDDFAQQQITKAFDISVNNDSELLSWSTNLARYFEGRPASEQVAYLDTLKRRNTVPEIGLWLDYFIARRLMREDDNSQRALDILSTLKNPEIPDAIALRAFRLHGTTLFTSDRFEDAIAVWSEGLERFPEDWEMNNNLAYALSTKLNRPEEAFSYAEVAISKNIGISEPYETMASIYIALGKYDEAEQMIDMGSRFINSVPARITMQITSGRLAMKRGNMQEARSKVTDARSVLRSSPDPFPELEQNIDEFEQELNSGEN